MFNKEKLLKPNTVLHIKTKEEYDETKEFIASVSTISNVYFEDVCYNVHCSTYSDKNFYEDKNFNILSVDDIRIVEFDEKILKENIEIFCENVTEKLNLFNWLHNKGFKWNSGHSLLDNSLFDNNYFQIWKDKLVTYSYSNTFERYYYQDIIKKKMYTIENIKNNKIAVGCKTIEEAKEFDNFTKEKCLPSSYWKHYKENAYYELTESGHWLISDNSWYVDNEYTIININQVIKVKQEEDKMKYELIKDLSGKLIVETACKEEFNIFTKKYGYYDNIEWTKENEEFIIKQNGWVDFFKEKGFIKEIKPKIVFNSDKIYVFKGAYNYYYKLQATCATEYSFLSLDRSKCLFVYYSSGQEAIDKIISEKYELKEFSTLIEMIDWLKRKILINEKNN